SQANASASDEKKVRIDREQLSKLSPADQERALLIADRLETIGTIDRSALSSDERKALRREGRDLKREVEALNATAGGTVIYISTGLIIIILLLIILL